MEVTDPRELLAAARQYEEDLPDDERRVEYPDAIITQVYLQSRLDLAQALQVATLPGGLRIRHGLVDATVAGFVD